MNGMNKEQIIKLLPELQAFIRTVRTITWLGLMASFVCYGLAAWFWLEEQLFYATVVATLGFVLFILTKKHAMALGIRYLRQAPQYHEMLSFVDDQCRQKGCDETLLQLLKVLPVIEQQKSQQ
jgi:FtsH-binding integral membrane protein